MIRISYDISMKSYCPPHFIFSELFLTVHARVSFFEGGQILTPPPPSATARLLVGL